MTEPLKPSEVLDILGKAQSTVDRQILKHAVCRAIFCGCGAILDVRDAVLIETDNLYLCCGRCYREPTSKDGSTLEQVIADKLAAHPELQGKIRVYDGKVLSRKGPPRKRLPKDCKPGKAHTSRYPAPTEPEPTMDVLEDWMADGVAQATDGCTVEPDGACEHGHPSWLRYLGVM